MHITSSLVSSFSKSELQENEQMSIKLFKGTMQVFNVDLNRKKIFNGNSLLS